MEIEQLIIDSKKIGEQVGVGATAAVFAYGDDRIIKVFKKKFDLNYVKKEYSRSVVAEQVGLPVPKNYGICQVSGTNIENIKGFQGTLDGCYAYLQDRIYGISLMNKVMENPDMKICGRLIEDMVGLQVKIHEIEVDSTKLTNQREMLHKNISIAPILSEEDKKRIEALLDNLPDGNRMCHGDYHMDNVFLTNKGLVCIDWCDLTCGNPMADLARSLLIFRCDGVPDSIPKEVVELTIRMRSICQDFYIDAYRKLGGKIEHLEEWLAVIAAARMYCEIDDNKQSMLKVVQEYLSK